MPRYVSHICIFLSVIVIGIRFQTLLKLEQIRSSLISRLCILISFLCYHLPSGVIVLLGFFFIYLDVVIICIIIIASFIWQVLFNDGMTHTFLALL